MGLTNKVAQITNESIFSNMDLHTYRKVHAMVVLYLHWKNGVYQYTCWRN